MEGSSEMIANKISMKENISSEASEAARILNGGSYKKLIELSENNLDPLAYFSRFLDILEMILQQLKGKDLINLSAASPFCYDCIASSNDLMEKIKIVFTGERELHQEDYDLLKNSSRKYQNIEVRRSFDWQKPTTDSDYISTSELDFFHSKARDWKNISINETYFRTKRDLWKFLSSIESSVESFSVCEKRFAYDRNNGIPRDYKDLKFPKLKYLKMNFGERSCLGETYCQLLRYSVAIEKLKFNDQYFTRAQHGSLTKILAKFIQDKNLAELHRQNLLLQMHNAQLRMIAKYNNK